MRLKLRTTVALLLVLCSPVSARAESSVGKVLKLSEKVELKVLELRRTKEHAVMFRYALANLSTQRLADGALGFSDNGAVGVRLLDLAGRKRFDCMTANYLHCVGSANTALDPGSTKEFWVYLTEPPETTTSVLLQVSDYPPQPVTIDPAQ